MRFSVKMIIDIPYSSFSEKTIRITADDLDSLITKAIPQRAFREIEILKETEWKRIGWKHVNLKFSFHGIQIEFVVDQEKRSVAAVYFSDLATGEVLSQSSPSIIFIDEKSLAEEVVKRAEEAHGALAAITGSG